MAREKIWQRTFNSINKYPPLARGCKQPKRQQIIEASSACGCAAVGGQHVRASGTCCCIYPPQDTGGGTPEVPPRTLKPN